MIEGVDVKGSPAWWLKHMGAELTERRHGHRNWSRTAGSRGNQELRPGLELLASYLDGDPPLPVAADGWKDGFREIIRTARMNVADLIVFSKTARMVPLGFRTAAADDQLGDQVAQRILETNDFELVAADTFSDMLGMADGYMMTAPPDVEGEQPTITAEDPRQMYTVEDPVTGATRAAVKMYRDDWDAADHAWLYLRDPEGQRQPRRFHAIRQSKNSLLGSPTFRLVPKMWDWVEEDGAGSGEPLEGGIVPVFRFQNRRGTGEFEPHLDTLDRINDTLLSRIVIQKTQAFRQRAVEIPEDDDQDEETGEPVDWDELLTSDPGTLWKMPPGTKWWESAPIDLSPIRLAVQDDVKHAFTLTTTPLTWFAPSDVQSTAEGASLQRESHVYAVEDRRRRCQRGLRGVMSACFTYLGDPERAQPGQIKTLWEPAERQSLSARYDAAQKAKGILSRERIVLDLLQYSPADAADIAAQAAVENIFELTSPAAGSGSGQPPRGAGA